MARSLTELSRFPEAIGFYHRALSHSSASSSGDVALYRKRLGALLIRTNDLAGALPEYQQAAALDEQRVRSNPANGRAKLDLSYDYSDWGLILWRMKKPAEALAQYDRVLKIRSEMAAADPRDERAADGLVSAGIRIAGVLADSGDRKASEAGFLEAIRGAESLIRRFPQSTSGRELLANASYQYGSTLAGKWSSCGKARPWLERARDLSREAKNEEEARDAEKDLAGCATVR